MKNIFMIQMVYLGRWLIIIGCTWAIHCNEYRIIVKRRIKIDILSDHEIIYSFNIYIFIIAWNRKIIRVGALVFILITLNAYRFHTKQALLLYISRKSRKVAKPSIPRVLFQLMDTLYEVLFLTLNRPVICISI